MRADGWAGTGPRTRLTAPLPASEGISGEPEPSGGERQRGAEGPQPRIGSVCSGYRGLDMAVEAVFGGTTAWVSDIDPGASAILAHHWPNIPNLGDITAVDWAQQEHVDILTAGFPCQDVSLAGKRAGLAAGTRSGLWRQVARAIDELQPELVVIENVRGLLSQDAHSDLEPCPWCMGNRSDEPVLRALGAVLGDLADLGFDAEWIGLPASDPRVGAAHERWREIILAWPATAHPDPLGWHRWSRDLTETNRRHEPAHRRDTTPAGELNLLPTPAARDWKSGASNLMDRNSRPLNEVAVNHLAGRRGWVGTNGVDYGPAIRRWEQVIGRPAPEPTEPGDRGNRRLSPLFTEWHMGLPAGHVTDPAIWDGWKPGAARDAQLKALGNGVVVQQVAVGIRLAAARAADLGLAALTAA